jgi:hypothetical protein
MSRHLIISAKQQGVLRSRKRRRWVTIGELSSRSRKRANVSQMDLLYSNNDMPKKLPIFPVGWNPYF